MIREMVPPRELADWLIGRGRHFVSTTEIAGILGVPAASVPASLERARAAGKLIRVTKGGWVPVPAEYRIAGAPPPSHFVHQLMEHLGHPHYVGFLSAAAVHGASHQVPMVFQVVTPARLRERRIGRGRLQFIHRTATPQRPRIQHSVPFLGGNKLAHQTGWPSDGGPPPPRSGRGGSPHGVQGHRNGRRHRACAAAVSQNE